MRCHPVVEPSGTKCRAGAGASVAQVPEPGPKSVVQVPEPQCPGCSGTAQASLEIARPDHGLALIS
jgi:hypothetical protein